MKKITSITLAVLLLTICKIFGQGIETPVDKIPALLCNKWEIDYVLMGGMKISRTPGAADIVYEFNKNKTFATSGKGDSKIAKGTWVYDEKKKEINLVSGGKSNMKVISLKQNELIMLADTKEATPDVPMQLEMVFKIKPD